MPQILLPSIIKRKQICKAKNSLGYEKLHDFAKFFVTFFFPPFTLLLKCMKERKKYDELTLKFRSTLLNLKVENRRDFA
ncbi:hypothetical protein FO521_07770 [Bacillus pseudomycoides]|uniref:Uncharacterized protein n=1 Tax=Bacillus pseudomycoides TaxID=64104 RepID=A0AAJ1Z0G5_9BACI|nr:hypothetical protein [Bacillus pseudomycoides]MDR4326641.1 hypothetical protein [Bacillus pseudomycoides]